LADHHHPLADKLEDMSFADGEKLNNRLMELSKGPQYATPDSKL
jgi:aristolochene synthase